MGGLFHSYVKLPEGTIIMNEFIANGMFLYHPPKKAKLRLQLYLGSGNCDSQIKRSSQIGPN